MEETTDRTFGEVPAGKHAMAVMGLDGDTKIIWDASQAAEVEAARAQFDLLVEKKRYVAFRLKRGTEVRGEQMRRFDPEAERIIFVPPMQGG